MKRTRTDRDYWGVLGPTRGYEGLTKDYFGLFSPIGEAPLEHWNRNTPPKKPVLAAAGPSGRVSLLGSYVHVYVSAFCI